MPHSTHATYLFPHLNIYNSSVIPSSFLFPPFLASFSSSLLHPYLYPFYNWLCLPFHLFHFFIPHFSLILLATSPHLNSYYLSPSPLFPSLPSLYSTRPLPSLLPLRPERPKEEQREVTEGKLRLKMNVPRGLCSLFAITFISSSLSSSSFPSLSLLIYSS